MARLGLALAARRAQEQGVDRGQSLLHVFFAVVGRRGL
jgi:hypothetical protein